MSRAVQHRKVVSFLVHFGPPTVVWVIGAYSLYRATKVDGSLSEKAFLFGILLVMCATVMGSSRRSRQTTTRERALELQLQRQGQRLRSFEQRQEDVERRLGDLADRVDTETALKALREVTPTCHHSVTSTDQPCMYVISSPNGNGNRDTNGGSFEG